MKMVLSKLFSIVVLQVLDSFQKGISSNFRSVIPALAGKTIKIVERGRQAFYYVHSDRSDGQYVNLFLLSFRNFQHQIFLLTANCFAKLKQMQSFKKVEQEIIFFKKTFFFTKTVTLLLLIYTNREKEFRAKTFIVMRREVGVVQKVGFASSSRNPLSVSTTDLRLQDKCRGNTLAL